MANRESRIDNHAIDFSMIRRRVVQRLAADGVICPDDRAVINAMDAELMELHDTAARHRFTAYVEKGGNPNTYMDQMVSPLGWKVVDIGHKRAERQIVRLDDHRNANSIG